MMELHSGNIFKSIFKPIFDSEILGVFEFETVPIKFREQKNEPKLWWNYISETFLNPFLTLKFLGVFEFETVPIKFREQTNEPKS